MIEEEHTFSLHRSSTHSFLEFSGGAGEAHKTPNLQIKAAAAALFWPEVPPSSLFIVLLNHLKKRTEIVQMSFLWLDFCSEC